MNGASPDPVPLVTVTASMENGGVAVKVSPWRAPVFHDVPLRIRFDGPPNSFMRIEPKNKKEWKKVADPLPSQAVAAGAHIPVGVRTGTKGNRGRYNIILTTADGPITIDPEIFICR
jgi:hypothetical protein